MVYRGGMRVTEGRFVPDLSKSSGVRINLWNETGRFRRIAGIVVVVAGLPSTVIRSSFWGANPFPG